MSKTSAIHYHSQVELSDRGRTINGLNVYTLNLINQKIKIK